MNKSIVLVTGGATGIGKLAVQSLAAAGHTVYASMRDTSGRNAARALELRTWSTSNNADVCRRTRCAEPGIGGRSGRTHPRGRGPARCRCA